MRRAACSLGVCALALGGGWTEASAELPRVVDIRVARHGSFDRLVVELERPVEVRRLPSGTGEFVLEAATRPPLPHQRLETELERLGTVWIDETPAGTRIRVEPRPRRERVYQLGNPPRIVMDFGDPGLERFEIPAGAQRVPERAVVLARERADADLPPVATPAPPRPGGARPVAPAPSLEAVAPRSAEIAAPAGLPLGSLPESSAVDGPDSTPGVDGLPAGIRSRTLRLATVTTLWLLLALGLGLVALGWLRLRAAQRRRIEARARLSALAEPAVHRSPWSQDSPAVGDRVELLARRIDEEVRARMYLEERVARLGEELRGIGGKRLTQVRR